MSDYRREIIEILAVEKITANETERLIAAFESQTASGNPSNDRPVDPTASDKPRPRYLRVLVEED